MRSLHFEIQWNNTNIELLSSKASLDLLGRRLKSGKRILISGFLEHMGCVVSPSFHYWCITRAAENFYITTSSQLFSMISMGFKLVGDAHVRDRTRRISLAWTKKWPREWHGFYLQIQGKRFHLFMSFLKYLAESLYKCDIPVGYPPRITSPREHCHSRA